MFTKKLMTFLIGLLFVGQAFAANIPSISNVSQVGGSGQSGAATDGCLIIPNASTITSVVTIVSNFQSGTAGNRYAFTKLSGGDGTTGYGGIYRVPTGKTFVATCVWYGNTSAAGLYYESFGYSTTSFTTNTAIAGGDVTYSVTSGSALTGSYLPTVSATTLTKQPIMVTFPALSYPFRYEGATTNGPLYLMGYEL